MAPIWLIPALTYLCIVRGQSPCSTPDNNTGDCRSIMECPSFKAIANRTNLKLDEIDLLKRSTCGFIDKIPKVCCPAATIQPPPEPKTCLTPEGNQGQCISIYKCKHIVNTLSAPPVTPDYSAYVTNLKCQTPSKDFFVCCGPPPPGMCVPSAAPPDPQTECCGRDTSSLDKIMGGNATSIDQYPWLAAIEYERNNELTFRCGGVLISGRYVLTAAHCVVGIAHRLGTPKNVRLGEYDISNPGRDCVPVAGGEPEDRECNNDPVVIPIERIIPHPDYKPTFTQKNNDIAMLRLSRLAPYTNFIRPICLPSSDVTTNMPPATRLFAAGWGANENRTISSVKLHVDLPYKTIETCQSAYNVKIRHVTLWNGQICAGGEKGRDTCNGDSGGPLMYLEETTYQLVGIVSFGSNTCGLENIPGVFTKVFEYLDWIKSNIHS